MPAKFTLSKDEAGKYRFSLHGPLGHVLATSKSYASRVSALNGVSSVRKHAADAVVDDTTATTKPVTPKATKPAVVKPVAPKAPKTATAKATKPAVVKPVTTKAATTKAATTKATTPKATTPKAAKPAATPSRRAATVAAEGTRSTARGRIAAVPASGVAPGSEVGAGTRAARSTAKRAASVRPGQSERAEHPAGRRLRAVPAPRPASRASVTTPTSARSTGSRRTTPTR